MKKVLFLLLFVPCYSVLTLALEWFGYMGTPDRDTGAPAPAEEQMWGRVFTVLFYVFGSPLFSFSRWCERFPWGQKVFWGGQWWQVSLFWSVLLLNSTLWAVAVLAWLAKRRRRRADEPGRAV